MLSIYPAFSYIDTRLGLAKLAGKPAVAVESLDSKTLSKIRSFGSSDSTGQGLADFFVGEDRHVRSQDISRASSMSKFMIEL